MEDIFGPRVVSIDRIFKSVSLDRASLVETSIDKRGADCCCTGLSCNQRGRGRICGACGCLDGFMIGIDKPPLDVSRDYRSEHYTQNAVNTQCMCDANLRFMYANVAAPGKTSDSAAFEMSPDLTSWLCHPARPEFEKEFFIVADAAYPLTDYSLIPFSGRGLTEDQRDYNYFLSQQRIRIEMAFGLLTAKFRIFQSNMAFDVHKIKQSFLVSCMLHNFIIDNDGVNADDEMHFQDAFEQAEVPHVVAGVMQATDPLVTSSARRNMLVQMINEDDELTRPLHTHLRNDNKND